MNITSSDPGSSGVLTPFAKVKNLYFDETPEEQNGIFALEKELAVLNRRVDENKEILFDLLHDNVDYDEYLKRREKIIELENLITFSNS